MLEVSDDLSEATEVWRDKTLDTHHGGVVLVDGHIYGSSWHGNGNGHWVCLDWNDGSVKYDTKWNNKGSIIAADGMLYCYEEKGGTVALVPVTPDGFKPAGTFVIRHGEAQHWAHPVIADGVLLIRRGSALAAYDIDKKYLHFLVGGGSQAGKTCVNLLVDGKVTDSACGKDTEHLRWATFDLAKLQGKKAKIQILDKGCLCHFQ